jgi:hypothetical protein
LFCSKATFAQNPVLNFEFEKRCQFEVIVSNLSDFDAYLWEVLIDNVKDTSFTTVAFEPVFSFEKVNQNQKLELRLIGFDQSFTNPDTLTRELDLFFRPEVNILQTNTVICSNEENVTFTADFIPGYEYNWEISVSGSEPLQSLINTTILPTPNEMITSWKKSETTTRIDIVLTLTENTSNDPSHCNYQYETSVLIISPEVPSPIKDSLFIQRKATNSNIMLCLNAAQSNVLYRWGFDSQILKTDTLPYCEYDTIVSSVKYWAIIMDKTFSACTSDTLWYNPEKSKDSPITYYNMGSPEVKVFPNPAEYFISIVSDDENYSEMKATLRDIMGRIVIDPTSNRYDKKGTMIIYLPETLNGVYFVEIVFDNHIRVIEKIIIQ